jgi:hypothetical protein
MRRKHGVLALQELRVDLRLVLVHVETSRGYSAFGERPRERAFINYGPREVLIRIAVGFIIRSSGSAM